MFAIAGVADEVVVALLAAEAVVAGQTVERVVADAAKDNRDGP